MASYCVIVTGGTVSRYVCIQLRAASILMQNEQECIHSLLHHFPRFAFQTQTYAAVYHDEHSSPFTWRTRSQQNLIFDIGRQPQYRDGQKLRP